MFKCKHCGGICNSVGNGKYECQFCGTVFSNEDFAPAKKKESLPVAQSSDNGADVFEKCVKGVCEISTSVGRGSGYLVSAEGYVITNSHVVCLANGKSCGQCSVKIAEETVPAQVVAMGTESNSQHCTNSDLAILKLSRVPFRATPLRFGDYQTVRTGESIYVIGNSLGYGTCITGGIVSDKNRNGQLMYDCATNPGNSGGPVFNSEGRVIGTHVAGTNPNGIKVQGMNYAIPATAAIEFLKRNRINIFY